MLAVLVVGAAAWSDRAAASGADGAVALLAGYRFAFVLTAALLGAGAVLAAALLPRPARASPRAAGA